MRRSKLTRISLVAPPIVDVDVATVEREYPSVAIGLAETADPRDTVLDADAWAETDGFAEFDHAVVRDARSDGLVLLGIGSDLGKTTREVLTRYQRFAPRRNDASSTGSHFDAALKAHAALHDMTRPLVVADYDHALDTWQWVVRLDPRATLSAQLAALFHDIERIESESDCSVEHFSAEYRAFKRIHARRGAELAARVLCATGLDDETCARVAEIISSRERTRDPEVALIDDADALSFFSLGSDGYTDYFGAEQARRKVGYKLSHLSQRAHACLDRVRVRSDVAAWMKRAA